MVDLFWIAFGSEIAGKLLQGVIKSHAITFIASSGVNLKSDFLYPYEFLKTGNTKKYRYLDYPVLYQDKDPYLDYAYGLLTGQIWVYERASGTLSVIATGSGALYYFKAERRSATDGTIAAANTQANSEDITIDLKWHPACVKYAAYLACMDKGTKEWTEKALKIKEGLKTLLPKETHPFL